MAKIRSAALRDPENGPLKRIAVWAAEGACIVTIVETGPEDRYTFCGLKLQLAPAGNPEHVRARVCLNPFFGVAVIVSVPEDPWATVRDELLIDNE
jgi:hypothetical protein